MADRRSSAPDSTRGLREGQQNPRDESRIARPDPRGYEERPAMVGYQDLRQRHVAGLMAMMPEMVQRLRWSRRSLLWPANQRSWGLLSHIRGVVAPR